ncbi:phage antirepressor N-terminal domain-containing protein [Pseudomonas mosselii]|uniref:phage antirepressor N-terminal domain-containing protein n=1 Tax=Pseudomonas mosselii TaxID=78327 RepID=UPI002B056179|nr:phage antirepressor N-terminal domain-containing protein [Pseudomonas mosselii]MEA3233917.1 phage antirepressor N-terminal domain-containing protein [Pseudomonas mosselii]
MQTGSSLEAKKPQCGNTEASGNEINFEEEIVMGDNSTAVSSVIPFRSAKLLLIERDGQPFIPMKPVVEGMGLDWKSQHAKLQGGRFNSVMVMITTTGADGKRYEMACLPLRKLAGWLMSIHASKVRPELREGIIAYQEECDDVLWSYWNDGIAVRQHDRNVVTVINELIGMSELSVIKGLIRDKGKAIAADKRQSFALTMHNRLHTRFNVPRTELIPAGQFEAACNFIAAYNVLEGEFIAKEPPQLQLPLNIHYPIEALAALREGMLTVRNEKQAWLDVTLDDIRDTSDGTTPLESLLWDLEKAGFDIRGAWWELRTYRNKLREITSFVKGLGRVMEEPQRYAVDAPKGRAAA